MLHYIAKTVQKNASSLSNHKNNDFTDIRKQILPIQLSKVITPRFTYSPSSHCSAPLLVFPKFLRTLPLLGRTTQS